MPIVDARDLFQHAVAEGYRVPIAAPDGIDDALAVIAAAAAADAPLIVDLTERSGGASWDIGASAVEAAAERSVAPVVLHLGDVTDEAALTRAMRLGCGAVTALPHASTASLAAADRLGVALLPAAPPGTDTSAPIEPVVGVAADHFAGSMARGRSATGLAACRRWRPVEHAVLFNAAGLSDDGVRDMFRTGTEMLASVPGVRSVRTGRALTDNAPFVLCWLVLFANARVVAHYRDHPTHVAFADNHFRPFAGDRMTIDFELTQPAQAAGAGT